VSSIPTNHAQSPDGTLPFNSVPTLFTCGQCQIPHVEGSVLPDTPTPLLPTGLQWQVWFVPCASDSPACRSEVPMASSLGLINLLERFTDLRETSYSLDYLFFIKGYNSGTAR